MKNTFTLALLLLTCQVFAQNTWNQRLPQFNSFSFPYQDITYVNGRFLLCGREQIAEFDQFGTCTGKASLPTNSHFSNFVRRKVDPSTGELFFLSGMRKIIGSTGYSLRIFKPNTGFSASMELPDSLGNPNLLGGAIIELDDSTVVVIGRKFAYKVQANGSSAFTQIWKQKIEFQTNTVCNTAVATSHGFVALSLDGSILGLDNDGQQLFSKTLPFSFYGATALPDGIIACGSNADQKAVLTKLTFEGEIIWSQVFADMRYNHVAVTTNGGFIATGTTTDNLITLLKTNNTGQQTWSKTYQKGTGTKVVAIPDDGYALISIASSSAAVYFIKTDGNGTTPPEIEDFFGQNRQLKNGGVKASFEPNASLFFNGTDGALISPANGNATSILTFSPQIGGFDGAGNLSLAADDYSTIQANDFQSGPVGGHDGDFNRVWLAKQSEIMALRRNFLIGHAINDVVPYDLLTWPAKGNTHNKYNIDFTEIKTDPMLQSAPFVDYNGDGKYNVFDGDYPRIKGDQMAWWMLNDDSTHLNSYAKPMKIDLAISAYLYDCPQNESVKNSVFVDFEFINRAFIFYDSCYLGFFTDFDFGCYLDDYVGSMPDANTYYVYNKDAEDLDCNGAPGFGQEVPVQTVTFQNRRLDHFIYGNNLIGSPVPPYINPSAPLVFYNFLQGNSSNGTRPTMGGTGYNPGSTDYVDHVFPDNPADPSGWSMCAEILPSSDRIAMGSHGPFTFAPNDVFKISVAFTFHHNIPHPCPDVFGLVKPAVQQLNTWSNAGVLEIYPNLGVVHEILGNPITLGMDIPGALFQWSTGASSPTIMVSSPGEYTVTVTGETGCQTVENVLVKLVAKTPPSLPVESWSVYPNPATDFIQVSCPECGKSKTLQILLRNALGAVVKREKMTSNTFPVQLQNLPAGLFWLELWDGGVYLGSKKVAHITR